MCMVSDDYVTPLGDPRTPTARKEHRCAECGRTIEPGETYERHTYIWEGEFDTHVFCAQCRAASRWLTVVCGGWIYSSVLEDLAEHLGEYDRGQPPRSSMLVRLVRYSERKWRRRDGSLVPIEDVRAWVDAALARVPTTMRGAA